MTEKKLKFNFHNLFASETQRIRWYIKLLILNSFLEKIIAALLSTKHALQPILVQYCKNAVSSPIKDLILINPPTFEYSAFVNP